MGAGPSITFTLVDATPYGLIYRMLANSIGQTTLPNAGGATPDLTTDALSVQADDVAGLPLFELLQTIVTTANEARWVMFGGGTQPASVQSTASPHAFGRARRARVELEAARSGSTDLIWAVDAINNAGVPNRAQLNVQVDGTIAGADDFAYLRIHYVHPKYSGLNLGSL